MYEKISLDRDAPRGLFLGQTGNKYLVCDHPKWRFALVLEHAQFPQFTVFDLGELPADFGEYEGEGITHFHEVRNAPDEEFVPGNLFVGGDKIDVCARSLTGFRHWRSIVYGERKGPEGYVSEWSLEDNEGDCFFRVSASDSVSAKGPTR